jgi:hypothetical protein
MSSLDAVIDAIADAVVERLRAVPLPTSPAAPPSEAAGWLDTKRAAEYLSVSAKILAEWREAGRGPKAHRVGKRAIRYCRGDLEMFVRNTSR